MSKKTKTEQSFEDKLTALEKLVQKMESSELALEDALSNFEQGIKLANQCQSELKNAEQKVAILLDGKLDDFETKDESST